ncbi:MAG: hypothetical protein CME63_00650 [Halobacteriovoraceae bacterium]|nr:hypothetical protein [Halobacteriovoraceae bacterium]
MMGLIQKIHILILLWGAWEGYLVYEAFNNKKLEIANQIPVLNQRIAKAQREKRQIKEYLRDIEEAKQNIEIVAKEVETLQRKLPETIKDAENLAMIKEIAEGLNIKNIYLSPGIEENKGFYFTKRYELSASGTYLQMLIFFEKIGVSERLLNIKNVEIKKSEEKQRGRFQLINAKVTIEAYRYNPNHKEDRGIDEIEKNFKDTKKKPRKRTRKKR